MNHQTEINKKTEVITISRNMDRDNLVLVEELIFSTLDSISAPTVMLRLQNVRRIDSKGIALCVKLSKQCAIKGKVLVIEATPEILGYLKAMNLDKYLTIRTLAS